MTDRPASSTRSRADRAADEGTALLAEMRAAVDTATRQLDELVSEVSERRSRVDELETVVDRLLGVTDVAVLLVDSEGRITGLSRRSAERFEGAAVGKPLSSVLPAALVDEIAGALAGGGDDAVGTGGVAGAASVSRLPGGGAVLVLTAP
ncbi:MAG TPA: hypothetical protein VFZ79_14455 [Acidimicrobiales bacterium]